MAFNTQQAYDELVAYIKEKGEVYSNWYCGITSDCKKRLFAEHKIPDKSYKWWKWCECINYTVAKEVEDAMHKLGCDGAAGGGDESTKYVYIYLKGEATKP